MHKLRAGMVLAALTAALLLPATGPAARNIRAKPDAATCAAARAQGQILPGCPKPESDSRDAPSGSGSNPAPSQAPPRTPEPAPPGAGVDSADEAGSQSGSRDRFMICPQNPRCPK